MASMSDQQLKEAAADLARELHAPLGEISIGTRGSGDCVELAVSLSPKIAYLMREVPEFWRGMHVRCQVASPSSTY